MSSKQDTKTQINWVVPALLLGAVALFQWPVATPAPVFAVDNGDVPASSVPLVVPATGSYLDRAPIENIISDLRHTNDPSAFPGEMAAPMPVPDAAFTPQPTVAAADPAAPAKSNSNLPPWPPAAMSSTPPAVHSEIDQATRTAPASIFNVQSNRLAGTAVGIAPNTVLAPYHIVRHGNVRVQINGQWLPATVRPVSGANELIRDAAVLTVAAPHLPVVNVRAPQYFEPVWLYGLRSGEWQSGYISGARTVSLKPSTPGTIQGDSGGPIVAEDGSLVGIVSGQEDGASLGGELNPRVVTFVRGNILLPGMQAAGGNSAPPLPVTPQQSNVVCGPNGCQVQYQYQYQQQYSPRRGRR